MVYSTSLHNMTTTASPLMLPINLDTQLMCYSTLYRFSEYCQDSPIVPNNHPRLPEWQARKL